MLVGRHEMQLVLLKRKLVNFVSLLIFSFSIFIQSWYCYVHGSNSWSLYSHTVRCKWFQYVIYQICGFKKSHFTFIFHVFPAMMICLFFSLLFFLFLQLKYKERVMGLILISPLCKAPSWTEWLCNKVSSMLPLVFILFYSLLLQFLSIGWGAFGRHTCLFLY